MSGAVFEMIGSVQADLFLLGGHHGEIGGRLYNPRTPISTAFLTLNLRGSTRVVLIATTVLLVVATADHVVAAIIIIILPIAAMVVKRGRDDSISIDYCYDCY